MAKQRGLEQASWEYTGLLGPRPKHFGGIYWAFDAIGDKLTEREILIDEADLRNLRLAFLSAKAEAALYKYDTKAVIEAHRIVQDFIRRCLE